MKKNDMPFIVWSEDFATGVRVLDEQHKRLFELISQMNDAIGGGSDKESLTKLLDALTHYTEFHFHTEEQFMARYAYPDKALHREGHVHLVDQLHDLKRDFFSKDSSLAMETIAFLREWLTDHILHEDKNFGAFLNSRGVT